MIQQPNIHPVTHFRLWINGRGKQWHSVADCSPGFYDRLKIYVFEQQKKSDIIIEERRALL